MPYDGGHSTPLTKQLETMEQVALSDDGTAIEVRNARVYNIPPQIKKTARVMEFGAIESGKDYVPDAPPCVYLVFDDPRKARSAFDDLAAMDGVDSFTTA